MVTMDDWCDPAWGFCLKNGVETKEDKIIMENVMRVIEIIHHGAERKDMKLYPIGNQDVGFRSTSFCLKISKKKGVSSPKA